MLDASSSTSRQSGRAAAVRRAPRRASSSTTSCARGSRTRCATALSPRHAPGRRSSPCPAIPRTLTGKKLELPVKRILTGAPVAEVVSRDALADPASIEPFAAYAEAAPRRLTPDRWPCGGRERRLAEDQVGGLLGDHHRRGVRVRARDRRHHRGVDDAQALDAVDAELRVDDRADRARRGRVVDGLRVALDPGEDVRLRVGGGDAERRPLDRLQRRLRRRSRARSGRPSIMLRRSSSVVRKLLSTSGFESAIGVRSFTPAAARAA